MASPKIITLTKAKARVLLELLSKEMIRITAVRMTVSYILENPE